MKDTIVELKQTIKDAAARQDQAKQDATIKAKHKEFQTLQLESGMSITNMANTRTIGE